MLDVVAEGGSYAEHRFGISGGGQAAGFGVAASASRTGRRGPVPNSDYHNEGALLNVTRRMGRQTFNLHADFDSRNVGEPGPYGSDPLGDYTGYDLISRSAITSAITWRTTKSKPASACAKTYSPASS